MKKLINVLLVLLLSLSICSCNVLSKDNNSYNLIKDYDKAKCSDYLKVLKNYHVRDKNENNTVDNEEFEKFLDDYFLDCLEKDYTSLYISVYDYSSYDIEKPEVSLGEFKYDNSEEIANDTESLNKLHSFDYDSLSYNQQFDYETLEYSLYENLVYYTVDFQWELLFNNRNDTLPSVIDFLNDFEFRNKEYLDDYMVLLEDTSRYLYDAIEYTNTAANEANYYLTDYSIDYTEDYIDNFLGARTNSLINSFNERIRKTNFLSSSEKNKYISKNKEIVNNSVIPAVKDVRDTIESYRGSTTSSNNIPRVLSNELAEGGCLLDVSYNISIDEMYKNAINTFKELYDELIELSSDFTVYNDLQRIYNGEVYPLGESCDKIVEFLEENYSKTHPDLGYIEYEISPIDASSANSSIIAYYMKSQVDNPGLNIIKYNPNNIDDGDIWAPYFTIAHETIPGHMYDFYRFFLNDQHPIMRLLSYIGATEGYAMYSEISAASYLDIDEKTQRFLSIYTVIDYILLGIEDLAINYYNLSDTELDNLFNDLGLQIGGYDDIRDYLESTYFSFLSYGVGLTNILNIKQNAQDKLGDKFSETEFNDLLTRHGRLPLVIIEDEVNKYVNNKLK